jgi:hypothetical protein
MVDSKKINTGSLTSAKPSSRNSEENLSNG